MAKDRHCRICVKQDGGLRAGGSGSDCVVVLGHEGSSTCAFRQPVFRSKALANRHWVHRVCRVARHCSELSGGERSLMSTLRQSRWRTPCWRLRSLWYFGSNCAFRQPVFAPKHVRTDTGSSVCRVARHCSELSGGERSLLSALRQSRWRTPCFWKWI